MDNLRAPVNLWLQKAGLCIIALLWFTNSFAQADTLQASGKDTSAPKSLEGYLEHRKGFLVKVLKSFMRDTSEPKSPNDLRRNDVPFERFQGYTIRNILVEELPFGIPINDSAKKIVTTLTKVANALHHVTRTSVIRRNLFFKRNDTIQPYLLADNVRFLRQLPYIQDATFRLIPAFGTRDMVDVIVITKDVFSIGGSIGSIGIPQSDIDVREDNIGGTGNAIYFQGLLDTERDNKFGYGVGYIQRNIGGSFMNAELAYQTFYPAIDGPKEENRYLVRLNRPLENRFMQWTYEFIGSFNETTNHYDPDSVYNTNFRYKYHNLEAWAGYNIHARKFTRAQEENTLRKLAGLRVIDRQFTEIPLRHSELYYWKFASITGVLGSMTFYRQNFYKTKYIYGFGRNEDIPEGLNLTLTAGITRKQGIVRPFVGFNYERSYFNSNNNYISYKLRAEGNLRGTALEDMTFLAGIAYVEHLNNLGDKWGQRFFFNIDAAQQVNTVLNEPLLLASKFGLPELGNNREGGTLRATVKAESVFFSPWSIAAFRFAPFIFANTSVFSPYLSNTKIYSSVGGGLRTRNESLIFGTLELKGFYFPGKNFRGKSFRFDISTNIRFKFNPQLIRKPDFIEIN